MKILVTGSRNWTDQELIRTALDQFRCRDEQILLIHGNARGADRIAARIGTEWGWWIESHPADWEFFGDQAGPIRNQEMVDRQPDIVLAFPQPGSVGTWDCVQRARQQGIVIQVWKGDDFEDLS